jgi:hexosaminidase
MHVLGAQACLWSENVKSFSQAERQVLPRLCALAEAVWTPPHLREWNDFQNRMQVHYARLDRMDWNYFIPPPSGFESANVFIQSMDVEMAVDLPAARIAYTLDGTDPFEQSAVYAGPVRISESLVLKARTFLPNGKSSDARTAFFTKQIPRQAVSDTALLRPGLLCRVFTGGIETLDRFSDLVYVRTDFPEKFDLPEDRPSDCFGLEFGGFIRVPRDGVYAFFTNSDDGSRLYIGQTLVVDNDGIHGENVVQGQIALSAGWHPLRVLFFENRYGELLKIGYKGPGMERREIPGAVLCH